MMQMTGSHVTATSAKVRRLIQQCRSVCSRRRFKTHFETQFPAHFEKTCPSSVLDARQEAAGLTDAKVVLLHTLQTPDVVSFVECGRSLHDSGPVAAERDRLGAIRKLSVSGWLHPVVGFVALNLPHVDELRQPLAGVGARCFS
jgi:hypothetical protein